MSFGTIRLEFLLPTLAPVPRRRVILCIVLLASCLVSACTTVAPGAVEPGVAARQYRIQLVNFGWHTGVAVSTENLRPFLGHFGGDFDQATWLIFGWGDREFYEARAVDSGMSIRALFVPTPPVLNVQAEDQAPLQRYGAERVRLLNVAGPDFVRLMQFLDGSFAVPDKAIRYRHYREGEKRSRFYDASGHYHAFNTCNTWTARALRAAGFPVAVFMTLTADSVMDQFPGTTGLAPNGCPDEVDGVGAD